MRREMGRSAKWVGMVLAILLWMPLPSMAQSQEVRQLLLNVEKLAQFKKILQNMYEGYRALEQGYNRVRDIASGNYKLHQVFLDGLLAVSPEVRKYYKVGLIIEEQTQLVKEYKTAIKMFRTTTLFSADELGYFEAVYKGLFDESVANLDALLSVVTAGRIRMKDDERLRAIDQLYQEMNSKLRFVRQFNDGAHLLALQRDKEQRELALMQKLHAVE